MKMAKVVAVTDATSLENRPELDHTNKRKTIEALLRRYPETSEAETAEITRFLATGPHLDVGLIAGSDEFKEKVAAFRREHRRHFRLTPWEVLMFVLVALGPIAALAYRYL